ncbi:hypothetical protein EJ06DRAFT_532468 [Trichodelitschia bisporula]|uniref:Uncharacterized protein n=1 Tax=Trichodelitschia bisporula TaxID=703511 RepID=A0A6G1HQ33_9PEZI|nr:hypothetical protein EJ06DRAFT_532468 [Trichodelitschia bisporula]
MLGRSDDLVAASVMIAPVSTDILRTVCKPSIAYPPAPSSLKNEFFGFTTAWTACGPAQSR